MRLACLLSLLSVLSVPAAAQVDGSIRGTVLADDGAPVSDAHVYADVVQGWSWIQRKMCHFSLPSFLPKRRS